MEDLGLHSHPGQSGMETIKGLTVRERWECLLTASSFFLLGTLVLDSLILALIVPEVLFIAGWVYLAGASSDGRAGWALFVGSVIVGAAALVASTVLVLHAGSPWVLYLLFLGPYVPTVFAPIVAAHAVLFAYLAARLAVGHKGPSILVGAGSIALVVVAIVGLLTGGREVPVPSFYFMPIGYALVALGAWRQIHHLRSLAEPELGP